MLRIHLQIQKDYRPKLLGLIITTIMPRKVAFLFYTVYIDMVVKLVQGWNDKNYGDIIDLPNYIAEELIRREIAIDTNSWQFTIDDNFWINKDLQWILIQEKHS